MKFAERLKFTATGTSAATITLSAAVAGFRTLAQAITDGALKLGDTGVPFSIDDGAGNYETSLFTVTSTTALTRTSVLSSSAGGATPAAFTGANLSVVNSMPADFGSKLISAILDASGNTVGIQDPKGNAINLIARLLANATTPATPAVEHSFKCISSMTVITDLPHQYPTRVVYAESKRKKLTFKNPASNTVSLELGFKKADNVLDPNASWTGSITIAPGQEAVIFFDDAQWWVRQAQTGIVAGQTLIIEREARV